MNDPSGIKTLGKQLNSSKYQVIAEVREGFDELKEELHKIRQTKGTIQDYGKELGKIDRKSVV